MRNLMYVVAMVCGTGLLMAAIIIPPVYLLEKYACQKKWSDYEPQFEFISGCRVVWEGKLTPTDNIGLRDIR